MVKRVRVALIGVGVMGKKYAEMIVQGSAEHMILTAVVVRKSELQEWAASLKNRTGESPKIYASSEELFAEPEEYDAVLIATPHKTHCELACKAFELGKHVMCDKPASITVREARKMTAQAEQNRLIYGMMFHQHKYAKYQYLKKMIDSGELGTLNRVMLVNARYFRTQHYHQSGGWRSSWKGEGGGALMNQGAHILDIWQWLLGMPKTLYANIPFGKYNDFEVDDEATVLMQYENNMSAVFMLTTGEAVWEERLEIIGSKGKLLLEDDTLHIWKYSCDSREYMRKEQVTSRENLTITEEILSFEKDKEPYPEMLEEFAQAVISGDATMLSAPGKDAIHQLMLTNAAYYSAWKKQRVELPIDEAAYEEALEKACEAFPVLF